MLAQGELPVVFDEGVQAEERRSGLAFFFRRVEQLDLDSQARAGALPPGGKQHPKAVLLQEWGRLTQEGIGFLRGHLQSGGASLIQALLHGREDTRRSAEIGQELLLRILQSLLQDRQGSGPRPPDLFGGDKQAAVVFGLQEEVKVPGIVFHLAIGAAAGGGFQTEASSEGHVHALRLELCRPGGHLAGEGFDLLGGCLQGGVQGGEGLAELLGQGSHKRLSAPPDGQQGDSTEAAAHQVVHSAVHEAGDEFAGCDLQALRRQKTEAARRHGLKEDGQMLLGGLIDHCPPDGTSPSNGGNEQFS